MDSTAPGAAPASPAASSARPTDITQEQIQTQTDNLPTSTPVEMNSLSSHPHTADQSALALSGTAPAPEANLVTSADSAPEQSSSTEAQEPQAQPQVGNSDGAAESIATPARPTNARLRQESSAIGPDTDAPTITVDSSAGPTVLVTLLLISGARHPYKIDEPYLRKRNVATGDEDVDPFTISVYTMKELIWRDWRQEWEMRPSSPSSIRLIHFGKLLDDKSSLKDYFKPDTPNVVHMSVKPQDLGEDEDTTKISSHQAQPEDNERTAGCGCRCVIL